MWVFSGLNNHILIPDQPVSSVPIGTAARVTLFNTFLLLLPAEQPQSSCQLFYHFLKVRTQTKPGVGGGKGATCFTYESVNSLGFNNLLRRFILLSRSASDSNTIVLPFLVADILPTNHRASCVCVCVIFSCKCHGENECV